MESLRWLNDWCLEGNNCHVEQLGQWELWTTLSTLLSFPMFEPLVFVAKTSWFYVSLISDNTRVGWRPDWWRRSCKKGTKRVDAARNLKTSTGNPRGVRIRITFFSMTSRLWKSKWWWCRVAKCQWPIFLHGYIRHIRDILLHCDDVYMKIKTC